MKIDHNIPSPENLSQLKPKSRKVIIINILIIIILLVGYFIYQRQYAPVDDQPSAQPVSEEELAQMREQIAQPPVVSPDLDLSEGQINGYLSQFDEALENVKAVNFDTLQGVNELAQIKGILGDFDGAITAWQYANLIRPANSLSFSNLAALYHYDLHEFNKAEEQYRISINNDPDDLPTIRNFYELYFYDLQDFEKAEALLLQAIDNNPEAADTYSLLARFYADTGEAAKAIDYYERHLEFRPDNAAARSEIARLKASLAR